MSEAGKNKTVIIVAGPTAVGKTAVAIEIAARFNSGIISADSRQCFREMNIGVARPSPEELLAVPHYFIATHSIREEVTAATFEEYALKIVSDQFATNDIVVMTGGTGLYLKAFCEGLDDIPEVPAEIRDNVLAKYKLGGISWLREEIREKDPVFFKEGESLNPQRMMRALEVKEATGHSILQFHRGMKKKRDFNILKIGLELPRAELQHRINNRVDKMVENGLVDEVKNLQPYRHLNALQTVGYPEMFDYLDSKIDLQQAIDQIKIHTRQYAKRQMTWFKKDREMFWASPGDIDLLLSKIYECTGSS